MTAQPKRRETQPTRALTKAELAAAARAAFDNAEALLVDARTLADAGRGARAIALTSVALEELGKAKLTTDLHNGRARRHKEPKAFWKLWNAHRRKTAYAMYGRDTLAPDAIERLVLTRLLQSVEKAAAELSQRHRRVIEHSELWVGLRELTLYSDVFTTLPEGVTYAWCPTQERPGNLLDFVHGIADEIRPEVQALPEYPPPTSATT